MSRARLGRIARVLSARGPVVEADLRRDAEAGLTLVEVLVVLVLIATVAGAVGLSLGSDRGAATLSSEMTLLQARFDRASDEALLSGAAVAFAWSETGYRFVVGAPDDWRPHPVSILGAPHALPNEIRLSGAQAGERFFVVTPDLWPAEGAPLELRFEQDGGTGAERLIWDGAAARREAAT